MTDTQLYLAMGLPVFAILMSMAVSGMQVNTINSRITSLESVVNSRITSIESAFNSRFSGLATRFDTSSEKLLKSIPA